MKPKLKALFACLLIFMVAGVMARGDLSPNAQRPSEARSPGGVAVKETQSPGLDTAGIFFAALAELESGGNDLVVGPSGEVSRYQITPAVWREYTRLPLRSARNPFIALAVARDIMLDRVALAQPSAINPQLFYLLWHRPATVLSPATRRLSPAEADRVQRFENLVMDGAYRTK